MNPKILREFLRLLTALRMSDFRNRSEQGICFGRCLGFSSGLLQAGLITLDQYFLLDNLTLNVSLHAGKSLPDARNVGPVMPASVALERRSAPDESGDHYMLCGDSLPKHCARVPANEQQVSAPAAPRELRLLCLLRPQAGTYQPAATLRPMPPRVGPVGRWQVANDPALVLRETQARAPSAEVLERCLRQRQGDAVRADSRTVRAGGVIA